MAEMEIISDHFTEINYKKCRFLITHRPSNLTIRSYVKGLQKYKTCAVVRVCEATYKTNELKDEGIEVYDLEFDDGKPPSSEIIEEWFAILRKEFAKNPGCCVAVHCIAGLGRAPVMVATALIELGLKYDEAVDIIRGSRRGAINSKQLDYLEKYRSKGRLNEKNHCCLQ